MARLAICGRPLDACSRKQPRRTWPRSSVVVAPSIDKSQVRSPAALYRQGTKTL
nr:hypothetical protein Iba_chr11aCG19410 [Ipomoea batatas]GMD76946.1 hypothetical protein Iba_scaffold1551029CG0010 [Ipomoea batatas]